MRVLVLTSRYTATRDIIGEDFGRQTRLFSAFKKLNNKVDFLVADYRKLENKNTNLHGINVFIRPFGIFGFFRFIKELNKLLKSKNYDFLIASSDPLWGVIGYFTSKNKNVKFVYDLHDNYEVYATYKLPFFKYIDNYIIKKSDVVTTVSHSLKEKISSVRGKNVYAIQNGVDLKIFRPMDKKSCRKYLNLPMKSKIIAYAGSLQKSQGVDLLVEAFKELKSETSNLKLVLAGRFRKEKIDIKESGIIHLKSLDQKSVAKLINAADVVVVPNRVNDFTKYCFPYKVVEYMACNTPLVATNVGDVGRFLKSNREALCSPDDKKGMKGKIKEQLKNKKAGYRKYAEKNSWERIARKLQGVLKNHS